MKVTVSGVTINNCPAGSAFLEGYCYVCPENSYAPLFSTSCISCGYGNYSNGYGVSTGCQVCVS
jgi:hypothetical protein